MHRVPLVAQKKRQSSGTGGVGSTEGMGICHSYTPDGRCVSLLKILLTNFCIYDCVYCVNRVSSNVRRARFTPEEVRPSIMVCLGATAAQSVFGADFRVLTERGIWRTPGNGMRAFATVHPSWNCGSATRHNRRQLIKRS